ncbi:hypothetical protein CR513_04159, partial [Mucuna pruriens]
MMHIYKYIAKARVAKRYNSIVFPHPLRQGDLVLRRVLKEATTNKLTPNWEGPYRVREDVGHGAFILEQKAIYHVIATETHKRQSVDD